MKHSDIINELAAAMNKAQAEMKPALKDSVNPHYKSKFSDFTSVWDAIRLPITKNGLTVWQDITTCDKTVSVLTKVVHISGQWVEFGPLTIPLSKFDAQGVGSATSYAKRYALCAALGVVSNDDDDGEIASAPIRNKQEIKTIDSKQIKALNQIKSLVAPTIEAIGNGDIQALGEILDTAWNYKKQSNKGISNPRIAQIYEYSKKHGAIGGKVCGAGGGGCMVFLIKGSREDFIKRMTQYGLTHMDYSLDSNGVETRILPSMP